MFLLSTDGRMQFRGNGIPSEIMDATIEALIAALHDQGALRVERTSDSMIEFDGRPRLKDYDAKMLVRVNGGRIEVYTVPDGIAIHYSISLKAAAIMAFWGSLLLMTIMLLSTRAVLESLIFISIGWLWLTGINYLITVLRFRGLVASAARYAIQ
jgi:hypothetical protein